MRLYQRLFICIFVIFTFLLAGSEAGLLQASETFEPDPSRCDQDLHCVRIEQSAIEQGRINFTGHEHYILTPDSPIDSPPDLDDTRWEVSESMWVNNSDIPEKWKGERWLLVYLDVDESMRGETIALQGFTLGAARFWLNGDLIYENGVPSANPEIYDRGSVRTWQPVKLSYAPVQYLMVHHGNPESEFLRRSMWGIGINLWFNDLKNSRNLQIEQHRFFSAIQWGVSSFCILFGLLHLFLWLYNRRLVFNLWFSIVCFLYAGTTWIQQQFFFYEDFRQMIQLQYLMQGMITVGFGFLGLFLYSVIRASPPLYFKIFFGLVVVTALFHVLILNINFIALSLGLAMGILLIAIAIRVLRSDIESVWLLATGVLIYIGSIFTSVGFEITGTYVSGTGLSVHHLPYLGFGIAIVTMSLFQSRHIASLNLNLTRRLDEVKKLSEQNLDQERSLREAAVQTARLETENERKTAELEQARTLQLSLLPASIPDLDGYRMHAAMQTATEVGGDYYDVVHPPRGGLIWALGDATGHGAEAGFLAAMTKTLVQSISPELACDDALRKMSAELRKVGLKNKFMCLGLLHINGNRIEWCSAGIPPVLIYRRESGSVELLESKGMPLGHALNFPYRTAATTLHKGDVVFAATDGLMEQMNPEREQYGLERITQTLAGLTFDSPEACIRQFLSEAKSWKKELPQQDDITLICIERTL